jgi:hypothetical protein
MERESLGSLLPNAGKAREELDDPSEAVREHDSNRALRSGTSRRCRLGKRLAKPAWFVRGGGGAVIV